MKAKTAKEVLIATKWILQNFDWCQKSWYVDTNGQKDPSEYYFLTGEKQLKCCCLQGALDLVQCDDQARIHADNLLEQTIDTIDIITWNDEKGRTKKQVISALNRAIKKD